MENGTWRRQTMNRLDNRLRRHGRTVVRCCAFAVAVVLLTPLLPWSSLAVVVPALSPFLLIVGGLGARSAGVVALIGLPVLIMVLLRRRWFCRWLCPVGLLTECAGRISPVTPAASRRVPLIGDGVFYVALAAAVMGYPMFLWLDPLAIFSGVFGLWHDPSGPAGRVAAGALAGVLMLSAVLPGAWCLKVCPLGATQELLAAAGRVLSGKRGRSAAAIRAKEPAIETAPMSRRSVLATAAGAVCAGLGTWLGVAGKARGEGRKPSALRPPGAVPGWLFGQLCIRCGNCIRACPAGIIHARRESDSIGDWLAPEVLIEDDYCREDCNACMQVCPSGAIRRGDLARKEREPIGLAHVDLDRCLLALNRECHTMCAKLCPYEAIYLHKWTWEDDRRYPIVQAQKCPGCGACKLACTPMDAIRILPPGVGPADVVASDVVAPDGTDETMADDSEPTG